jgi:two-component system copper resistance phosphate regulon response regulator CusR
MEQVSLSSAFVVIIYIMKILLVEDNDKLAKITADKFRMSGHVTEVANTFERASYLLGIEKYDIAILDRMLPEGKDGLELCRLVKKGPNPIPVIMLTAMSGPDNRINGYSYGADDYLEKPFVFEELLMRLRIATRKNQNQEALFSIGNDISVDLVNCSVVRKGQPIRISRRLWNLLEYFILHKGQTLSKEVLIDRVWGLDSDVLDNTIETAVRRLRVILGDDNDDIILTVRGFGYRLEI